VVTETAARLPGAATSTPVTPRGGGVTIRLDEHTGLPASFAPHAAGPVVPLRIGIELETGGDETPGTTGGLTYVNTHRHTVRNIVPGSLHHTTNGPDEAYVIDTSAGNWLVRLKIAFRPEHPRVELRVAASPTAPDDEHIIRDLYLDAELAGELSKWLVEAPGNKVRPNVSASAISEPVSVDTAGHELGSPGIIALHHVEQPLTLIVWPFSRSEQGRITVQPSKTGLGLHIGTQLAGAVKSGEWLEHGPIYLDVFSRTWDDVRRDIKDWYPSIGLQTPDDRPAWSSAVSLFEVMVGSAPFYDGYQFAPYPSFGDLIDDLDRIAELGFECLQLMPRHPYPSYNIHQPGDVATTYGSPKELQLLVDECHRRGLRIILDILLHGVIDKTAVEKAAELVRNGPHIARLDEPGVDLDVYGPEHEEISWCRHILAFEPYWLAGSPPVHSLLNAHPEWFMRGSSGSITGRYTHALDTANVAWQGCFITACEALIRDYSIDGFRVDAPLYNHFANWSESSRRHASYSSTGYLQLFRKLRRRLHDISTDVILYTEPSGPFARESLDLNYGYPERWLITSMFDERLDKGHDWRRVTTGKELADWFRDFDSALPAGSVTAHFVDCHDTMWWRLTGDHWRREQVGLPATKALVPIYALRGGAYMTVVGGEEGLEAELKRAHALRRYLPEIRLGTVDYESVSADSVAIYGVLRHDPKRATIVAINTSKQSLRTTISVNEPAIPNPSSSTHVLDAWTGEWLPNGVAQDGVLRFDLTFGPYQTRVIVLGDPPSELNDARGASG
jgi:Alpha amylase, catalytic domain